MAIALLISWVQCHLRYKSRRGWVNMKRYKNSNHPGMPSHVLSPFKKMRSESKLRFKPQHKHGSGFVVCLVCITHYLWSKPSVPSRVRRGKPQHCRFITSACLSVALESQFQPLSRRKRRRRSDKRRSEETVELVEWWDATEFLTRQLGKELWFSSSCGGVHRSGTAEKRSWNSGIFISKLKCALVVNLQIRLFENRKKLNKNNLE